MKVKTAAKALMDGYAKAASKLPESTKPQERTQPVAANVLGNL